MTDEECRILKRSLLRNAHTGIRVEQLYPDVESIEIHHIRDHGSAFGHSRREGIWTITPQSEACFILECLNPECSTIGFNLKDVISSAIHHHTKDIAGEMECEGQEAPDHPEQSCSGTLKFTIEISYYK